MKILIACTDLISQAELLAAELTKLGYNPEVTQSLHPARLILNRYDVVHYIENQYTFSLQRLLFILTAKSLQIPNLLTCYSFKKQTKTLEKSLALFDAMTCSSVTELKKLRHFSGPKIILPYIPNSQSATQARETASPLSFVLPVTAAFDDLHVFKNQFNHLNENFFYVDTTNLTKLGSSSKVRKSWDAFTSKNAFAKQFILITEKSTLENILQTEHCRILLSWTEIDHLKFASWIEYSLKTNSVLVMNEQQATGFAPFWQSGKNCILTSDLKAIHQKIVADTKQNLSPIVDEKLNDLARIYLKISQLKYSLLKRNQAS